MRMFDVQGIEIVAPRAKVFEFLREPGNLAQWAHAFVSAEEGRARLEAPAGAVDVGLDVSADAETGTVDWRLAFPDGSVGVAQSRVTDTTRGTCIYSFVLHAPPVALGLRHPVGDRKQPLRHGAVHGHAELHAEPSQWSVRDQDVSVRVGEADAVDRRVEQCLLQRARRLQLECVRRDAA